MVFEWIWIPLWSILFIATLVDIATYTIPNWITRLGLLYFLFVPPIIFDLPVHIYAMFATIGAFAGAGCVVLINIIRPYSIGYGDVKCNDSGWIVYGLEDCNVFLFVCTIVLIPICNHLQK